MRKAPTVRGGGRYFISMIPEAGSGVGLLGLELALRKRSETAHDGANGEET